MRGVGLGVESRVACLALTLARKLMASLERRNSCWPVTVSDWDTITLYPRISSTSSSTEGSPTEEPPLEGSPTTEESPTEGSPTEEFPTEGSPPPPL